MSPVVATFSISYGNLKVTLISRSLFFFLVHVFKLGILIYYCYGGRLLVLSSDKAIGDEGYRYCNVLKHFKLMKGFLEDEYDVE